ncbi:MAG: EAL domain-containing protein [Hydrocarboniphaga effusa]|nr:EAL domain-containing protein [Hydrocarboniphaga effusa]
MVSSGEEVAKRIESHLRNSGHPVRAAWVTDLEDMEDVIRRSPPDLVLCAGDVKNVSPRDALELCNRLAPDLPMLLLGSQPFAVADTVAAFKLGARGLVTAVDPRYLEHLEQVCLRELAFHYQMRELRGTRARLADYESRHKKLVADTGDAVAHVQEGIITHANAAFATLLGYESPEAIESNPLMDFVAAGSQVQVKQFLKLFASGKTKPDQLLELAFEHREGRGVPVAAHVTLGQDDEGRLLELLIRSATPAATKAVASPAASVAGTGAGRLELLQTLKEAIQSNVQMPRALMLAVVDGFPALEERLGYHDAEQTVAQLAELLKQRLGLKEPLFRFSNSELALVVSRAKAAEFETLAETLRKDVATQLFKSDAHEAHLAVTLVSYPLSSKEQEEKVVETVVREARKLSSQGGNRIAVLGPTALATQVAQEELRRAEQVKKALQENRIKLAFQSIASLEGDERQHFDVLVRMVDETGNEVPARDFIPAAEKFGLITAVDRFVVSRALIVLAKRQNAKNVSALFVRISEQTLKDGEAFYKWLAEALKARPLRKDELVFSIQESLIETHVGKANALCKALKSLGAEIAVDHYGVGKNSAQVLTYVPAGFVRFHYSFSKDFNDPALQKKMADLMEVAKQRKIRTIVGQVEDANAMARLWQLGVNYIQGFHIQAPEAILLSTDLRS